MHCRPCWQKSLSFIAFLGTLSLFACGDRSGNKENSPQVGATENLNNSTGQDLAPANDAYYIFIVPGFGYDFGEKLKKINPNIESSPFFKMLNALVAPAMKDKLPADGSLLDWQQTMEDYVKLFKLPSDRVRILNYSYFSDTETIKTEINQQITQALASAPSDARFDVIGHSEGGFAGFYGVMDGPNASKLRQFVSLAGVPLGWTPTGLMGAGCRTGACGLAHTKIIPRRSPFINEFLNRNAAAIKQVSTCSLYASNDGFVEPANAGVFETDLVKASVGQEVPGMTHLKVFDPEFFNRMQTICYPDGFHITP